MRRPNTVLKASIVSLAIVLLFSGCERELSDEAALPSFATTAAVFTDDFIGLGADFYFPFADAKPDVFSVDNTEGFESNASIRIDVPNANDPSGSYAGAIFRVEGAGRNLTNYDALTFYVKASQGVLLGNVGFGIDYLGDKYRTETSDVNVSTNWTKVIVPIPDPSKLLQERGLFWFAAGTQETGGSGYTLWFDEIRFEKLGTVGNPTIQILEGATNTVESFTGSSIPITGLSQVYNLVNGQDVTVSCAPAYYEFSSSDTSIVKVSADGIVNVEAAGNAEVTATLKGLAANGKLIVESKGDFPAPPTPPHSQANVRSLFSDTYTPATGINYAPGFGGSTTLTTIVNTSNGEVLQYSTNNYTGIMFDNPIDGSDMEFLHIDAFVQPGNGPIGIQIRDIGANQTVETNEFTGFPIGDDVDYRTSIGGFTAGEWKSFDIPLAGDVSNQKDNLGAIIITGGPDFILDNIYFFKN